MNSTNQLSSSPICQVCGVNKLREVEGFAALSRITSDCRNYKAGGRLFVCIACGGVQKLPDEKWLQEIEGIYARYEAYYQSGGDEQIVFDRVTGTPRRRSDAILARLAAGKMLEDSGHALDVGCGNGATLLAMSAALAGWSFSGYELIDRALSRLSNIPRFQKLYTGSLDAVGRSFDLVTQIHSLEHFPAPLDALIQLNAIVGTGQLFIEVSNVDENPFDILVADHLMHFSPGTLRHLLKRAGFQTVMVAIDWVPKEISLLAKANSAHSEKAVLEALFETKQGEEVLHRMVVYIEWLQNMVKTAERLAKEARPLGIFGTSIAATWLASQLGERVSFFVDEDESRVGKVHLGRPIIRPSHIPPGGNVYLALAPSVAEIVATRLADLPCLLFAPPPLQF
jgi:SAM-dependent methyltransferase